MARSLLMILLALVTLLAGAHATATRSAAAPMLMVPSIGLAPIADSRVVDQTPAPVVTLTAIPRTVTVGQPVTVMYQITGVGQNGFAGNLVVDFNDGTGSQLVSPGQTVIVHVFTQAGTFRIRLSGATSTGAPVQGETAIAVTAAAASSSTGTTPSVTVSSGPIQGISLTAAPRTGSAGEAITFAASTATSTSGCGNLQYRFSFGDDTSPAIGQMVTHSFKDAGTYTVTLTVTDCIGQTGTASTSITIGAAPVQGISVQFQTGWNIVAGPAGTVITGTSGPLYTFQPGDAGYEIAPSSSPIGSGLGYWAYFTAPASVSIPLTGPQTITVKLPIGQYVMIGNPGNTPATVSGADSVVTFDPSTNGYVPATMLAPGQGAWAVSNSGTTATIANAGR